MLRFRGMAVVALLGVAVLAGCSGSADPPARVAATGTAGASTGPTGAAAPATATTSFPAHPLQPAAARSMETALASGDEGKVRAVLDVPATQKLDPALTKGLKSVAPIVLEDGTFRQLDAQTATVTIRTGGKNPQTWDATLLFEAGAWKIALTTEAGS